MSLPSNFASAPDKDPNHFFHNVCLEFIKTVNTIKDTNELQQQMNRLMDVSRQMNWHEKNTGVYHKNQGEKVMVKVWEEFKRYIHALNMEPDKADPQDLLSAIGEVDRLAKSHKVT